MFRMADHRIHPKDIRAGTYWADAFAEKVVTVFQNEEVYTCAAGISPSGVVHFGNFRDVVTSVGVSRALEKSGKKSRVIFSWDNFDRFRKVPTGVPESWIEHIGKPLTAVPDPFGCHESYAFHFQSDFEKAMDMLGISLVYINQTHEYQSGRYDDAIIYALNHRFEIADILLSFMTEKAKGEKGIDPTEYRQNYYPVSVYSRFSGKDSTKILDFDGKSKLTYRCIETGKEETIDIRTDHIVKLSWKIDWPMRWKEEGVVFEPGGHDHASPGGSYDTSSVIAEKIFNRESPVFAEYKFVGIQGLGAKMSGSKGNAISPLQLLEIYEPNLLNWLYFKKSPDQPFQLAFDSEVFRQYDEFDREQVTQNVIPFRQAVGYGQIVQWNEQKLGELLAGIGIEYDRESIHVRMPRARAWLETYNPEEMISVLEGPNTSYIQTLDASARERIIKLRAVLENGMHDIKDLETLVYDIPKQEGVSEEETKKLQRGFFKDVYQLLIGKDTGPRLSTFLWVVPREKVLRLLDI